ncbi:MAG: hypothetical protein EB117_09185 [Betaproteobacteria bacterium]|nr:hypothetical protein [Betaproteobacteria bacterium]
MVQPYKFDAAGDPQGYGDELVKQGEWLPGFSYTELIPATQLEQAGVVDIEATKRTIFTKMGDSPKWTPSAFALASEVVDWCAEAWKLKGRE